MKEFKVRKGVFLKSTNSTSNMMYTVLLTLVPFIIFATFKNGIYPAVKGYASLYQVFKPLIFTILSSVTCLLTEYIYYKIKKEPKTPYELFTESYAIIPGVFLSLIISINTPIYLIIIGSIIASLSKVLSGGLGKNKLNPALVGSLFITVIFSSLVGGYLNPYEIDTISTATPLTNMTATNYLVTYDNLIKPYGSLLNFLFGTIPGSVGETCSLLCIISFIYLAYKKIIKWRIPTSYVIAVALISLIICLTKEIGLWFILYNILSGGLLFGATFMATDPVTTPISKKGQIISGILMGIITMTIRYLTPLPEGVLISILIVNIITIYINKISIKLYSTPKISNIILITLIITTIPFSLIIKNNIITKPIDDTYEIISKVKNGQSTIYEVKGRGYAGNGSIKLKITFTKENISNIELISSHETYTNMIYTNDYLTKIKNNQNNLDNLDTISGCTYTSKYLKEIIQKTKEDYNK